MGIRRRRRGARAFGGRVEAPSGLGRFEDAANDESLVAIWGSGIYTSTGNGGWASINNSAYSGSLHQIVPTRISGNLAFAVATCEEQTDPIDILVYDIENEAMTLASGPDARCIVDFESRLWAGRDQTLFWSDIGGPADWPAANSLDIEPGLAGHIVSIIPSRGENPHLWIFKKGALLVFEPHWGSSSALIPSAGDALDVIASSLRILSVNVGCFATKSVVWVPGEEGGSDLFFLAEDGVRTLRRADNDAQAGAGFPVSFDNETVIDRINWAAAHRAAGAFFDNAYHLAIPLDGAVQNTHILRYDILTKAWTLLDWQGKDCINARLADNNRFFFQSNLPAGDSSVTNSTTESLFQVFRGYQGDLDPSETHIRWLEDSRAMSFGEPLVKKQWNDVTYTMSAGETLTYEVAYRVDQGEWRVQATDILPGAADAIVLGRDPLPWTGANEAIRKRSYSLTDVTPGYFLQVRLGVVSDATDIGRISVYTQETTAAILQPEFVVED